MGTEKSTARASEGEGNEVLDRRRRYRGIVEGDWAGKVERPRLPQESIDTSFRSLGEARYFRTIPKCAPLPNFEIRTNADHEDSFLDLETLNLSDGIFSFETFDSNLYFPKLRRLVLSLQPVLQGDIEDIQGLLSPAHLPNLTHLALQSPAYFPFGPAQLFGSILPQITTLALSDLTPHYSSSALLELIGRCSNLKHLSLAIESNDIESRLFADAAGMELESLHMSSSAFVNSNTLLSRLAALGKGEPETIKVKRVVIYEEEGRLPAIRPYMADGDVFEWRLNRDVPPFEDFDGR